MPSSSHSTSGFLSSPEAAAAGFSSVERLVYGGSPISETVMIAQRVFGAQLSRSYGLTETIGVTPLLGPEDHAVGATASCSPPAGQFRASR